MKLMYDKEADAAFIRLTRRRPDGAIELQEGVILHVTRDNKIVAIEILDAKDKLPKNALIESSAA